MFEVAQCAYRAHTTPMTPPAERPNRMHLLLSDDESKMLDRLAEDEGVTASDVLRTLVRRAHAGRFEGLTGIQKEILATMFATPERMDPRRIARAIDDTEPSATEPAVRRALTDLEQRTWIRRAQGNSETYVLTSVGRIELKHLKK